ncbi:MAG: hypothetical protein JWP12_2871 [Bacteroidetes bacterium]|nr:hypothetical protein [Bacteroidota bacterium]
MSLFLCCFFAVSASFAQADSIPTEQPGLQINYIKNQLSSSYSNTLDMDSARYVWAHPFNKKRLAIVLSSEAVLYGGSLYGLNTLWYKDYPRSAFHFFNDNDEWLQMDKVGHMTTSYYIGRVGIGLMNWTGLKRKKAIWYGGMLGSLYQTTIEVLDGYSSQWGFSLGDFAANTAGSFLCVGQQLAWNEQRIVLKYSFQQSPYAKYRPNLLGSDLQENVLKDYNGQIYWLSVNLYSFMNKDSKFPKWLNIAAGYGANGMTGGSFNPPYIDENGNQIYFDRYRQFYLSLDVDLTRIKTKSRFLKSVFYAVGFIKIPAPALEFSKHGVKGNMLGF